MTDPELHLKRDLLGWVRTVIRQELDEADLDSAARERLLRYIRLAGEIEDCVIREAKAEARGSVRGRLGSRKLSNAIVRVRTLANDADSELYTALITEDAEAMRIVLDALENGGAKKQATTNAQDQEVRAGTNGSAACHF